MTIAVLFHSNYRKWMKNAKGHIPFQWFQSWLKGKGTRKVLQASNAVKNSDDTDD